MKECCKLLSSQYFRSIREGDRERERGGGRGGSEEVREKSGPRDHRVQPFFMGTRLQGPS